MIKLLYNVSTLGIGHFHPPARTGVYRVVENLAQALKQSPECDLKLCAHATYFTYAVQNYLSATPALADLPLTQVPSSVQASLYTTQRAILETIPKAPSFTKQSLRTVRKTLGGVSRALDLVVGSIDSESLAAADIFHSPFEPIPSQVQRAKHLKRFLTVHDLIPILLPEFFQGTRTTPTKRAIDSIDRDTWVTCVSQSTKNDLCNYSKAIDPNKVFVTHLAASELFYPCTTPLTKALIKQKYNIPDAPYLLSLSTLEPRKNIAQTIHSFAQLIKQERIADLNLVLVGAKGWNFQDILDDISASQDLSKRVLLTGYVDDKDLAPLYSDAVAFVYPSFYEGFGLPPLEAMQCGVPVITSNTSSLPEVVGDAGITLDPKDGDGLSQAMLCLYNDSVLRQHLAQASLARAQTFSWQRCAQQTIAAYKTSLSA